MTRIDTKRGQRSVHQSCHVLASGREDRALQVIIETVAWIVGPPLLLYGLWRIIGMRTWYRKSCPPPPQFSEQEQLAVDVLRAKGYSRRLAESKVRQMRAIREMDHLMNDPNHIGI